MGIRVDEGGIVCTLLACDIKEEIHAGNVSYFDQTLVERQRFMTNEALVLDEMLSMAYERLAISYQALDEMEPSEIVQETKREIGAELGMMDIWYEATCEFFYRDLSDVNLVSIIRAYEEA